MSRFEYRVCWRREHAKRKRSRLYQTQQGAEDFARFLSLESWDELDDDQSVLSDNLRRLGNAIHIVAERRVVGEWEAM